MKKIKYLLLFVFLMVFMCGCGSKEGEKLIEQVLESEEGDGFTLDEFPFYNQKESKKLVKFYNKIIKGKYDDYCFVEEDSRGRFKATMNEDGMFYVGEMKNNRPHGKGVLFDGYGQYDMVVLGNFKKGRLDGYVIQFSEYEGVLSVSGEGECDKNRLNGTGVEYNSVSWEFIEGLSEETREEKTEVLEIYGVEIAHKKIVAAGGVRYLGDYKDGERHGKGEEYSYENRLLYEGEFKDDEYHGKGTLYYEDGETVQYKGKFKKGDFHGKGKLYDENGKKIYKGKFKNGDYK